MCQRDTQPPLDRHWDSGGSLLSGISSCSCWQSWVSAPEHPPPPGSNARSVSHSHVQPAAASSSVSCWEHVAVSPGTG